VSGAEESQIAALRREVEASLRIDGPAARAVSSGAKAHTALLDSDTRTSALVLRALLALDKAHPLAPRLALGLLADRRGGVWRSTQEAAWALLALDAFRRAEPSAPADFDARVFLGSSLLAEASFHGASGPPSVALTLPIAELIKGSGQPLTFAITGTGELHYEARLRFARKALPTEPQDGGFFVQKTMQVVRKALGAGPSPGRAAGAFAPGDLVLCEVEVVTPSPRDYVVVDDPLPGGFEAVDIDLRKGGDELRWLERSSALRREIHDDRVLHFIDHLPAGLSRYRVLARATTPGTFVLPPTRVEEMYVPETFGATAARVVQIGGQ
jgi:uncharacterized protein YfaS (alpha-2-macroglobulin family)